MSRESYREMLDELRENVLYLGELVEGQLRDALDALVNRDEGLAQRVVQTDDDVDDLFLELESDCVDLLALQQPVAGDLRLIVASFKILTDLERIGDLAVNLAEYATGAEYTVAPDVDVQRIGETVLENLSAATDAYAAEDPEQCFDVAAADDEVDAMCETASESVVRSLVVGDGVGGPDVDTLLSEVSRLLLTLRDLERAGDHAVNVAGRTLFAAENDDALL